MTELIQSLSIPGPIPTGTSMPFWKAAQLGELALQRCSDCDAWFFYARTHCPRCWSHCLNWHAASGTGVIKSFSVVHRPGHPAWAPAAPYVIALVELQEGPTMLSQLLGDERLSAQIGQGVKLCCVPVGQFTLPFFELTGERGSA